MTRPELIHKLVTTYHLSVPERAMLGVPVTRAELHKAVHDAVSKDGIFQSRLGQLMQLNNLQYELVREFETGISQTEEARWRFDSLDKASAALVQHILNDHPSGTVDGIRIVE